MLAARHGLGVYRCDDHFERHLTAADPATCPALVRLRDRLRHRDWPVAFLRPARALAREELAVCAETFRLVVADLAQMPGPVIAEGTALLPSCVAALRPRPTAAAWLVPSPAFHEDCYGARAWARQLVADVAEPQLAYANWRRRDTLVARVVRWEAGRLGFPVFEVARGVTPPQALAWVEGRVGPAPPGA